MAKKVYFCILAVTFLVPGSAFSQTEKTRNDVAAPAEEIVITEDRPTYQIRALMEEAEEALYEIFNALNDEKRFEISCVTENRVNSRMDSRHCLPEFHRQELRSYAQDYLAIYRTQIGQWGELSGGNAHQPIGPDTLTSIKAQRREFNKKMAEIARSSPEFQQALIRYVELQQQYERAFSREDLEE